VSGEVVVVGVNHRTAPVEVREQVAVSSEDLDGVVRQVRALPGVREAMVVATCNRVEVYALGDDPGAVVGSVRGWFAARGAGDSLLYEHARQDAIRHTFRVCASLDSLVVGEPQILGQVKEAYHAAQQAGGIAGGLSRLMAQAFHVAKRVRTETGLAAGQVSVASVAVDLARGIFGELQGRKVLVVGAGKMALGAARGLARHGASMAIANRSYPRAEALAKEHHASAHPLTDLPMLLQHSDVVVCSTASTRFVLTRDDVAAAMKVRRGKSLFVIDITVPRNVDPRVGDLDNVYLYNVDDLEQIVAEGARGRAGATQEAERLLEDELVHFAAAQRAATGAGPTIAALRRRFRETAQAELERSLHGRLKHLGVDDRRALETMLDATVNKLLHHATVSLKKGAETGDGEALAASLREVFDLQGPQGERAGATGSETREDDAA